MKISKSSWHYRLLNALTLKVPDNLCQYFWKLIWNIILLIWVLGFILCIAFCMIYSLYIHQLYSKSTSVILGNVIWLMLIVAGFFWILFKITDYFSSKIYKPVYKKPNIVLEYLKAKKNKYCPKIEFKD